MSIVKENTGMFDAHLLMMLSLKKVDLEPYKDLGFIYAVPLACQTTGHSLSHTELNLE